MTETAAKWAERVRAWRASGKTAETFAAGQDFEGSTLRYWSSRLKTEAGEVKATAKAASALQSVAMARVIRRRRRQPVVAPIDSGAELAVVVNGARITVNRGFDAVLLREVVAALGGAK